MSFIRTVTQIKIVKIQPESDMARDPQCIELEAEADSEMASLLLYMLMMCMKLCNLHFAYKLQSANVTQYSA